MVQTIVSGVQHQLRRGDTNQITAFVGAQGEVIFDTTFTRPIMQDGVTAGGFAASIATVQQSTVSAVINNNTAAMLVAASSATTITLPLVVKYATGQVLTVADVAANAGTFNITIVVSTLATDTIFTSTGGSTTQLVIGVNGKSAQFISNSSGAWVGAIVL